MIIKEMRRKDRMCTTVEAKEILRNGKFGVMSVIGEDGYPYGVPLHYVMIEDNLYFHSSAKAGHKALCLERNPNVCFTVVETEDGIKCRSAVFLEQLLAYLKCVKLCLKK